MQTNPERFRCKTHGNKGAQEVASPPVVCISPCWVTVFNYIYFFIMVIFSICFVICSMLCLLIQARYFGFIFGGYLFIFLIDVITLSMSVLTKLQTCLFFSRTLDFGYWLTVTSCPVAYVHCGVFGHEIHHFAHKLNLYPGNFLLFVLFIPVLFPCFCLFVVTEL